MVVQDDSAATTSGIQPYYVGYWYDSTTSKLYRGELSGTSITSCTLPVGDPSASPTAVVLADNVVQVDNDKNGSLDPVFAASGNNLVVNLGIRSTGGNNQTSITQPISLTILRRTV